MVCLRNKLTDLVEMNELGRFFSVLELCMSGTPFVGALVYSNIFSAVVSFNPGIIYYATSMIYLIIISISLFEQFFCKRGFWAYKRAAYQ